MLPAAEPGASIAPDRYRPKLHYTPSKGWMNDPNGLVRTAAGFHAFFQHNPSQPTWGNIVWGHAFSKDLLSWQDLGVSLAPDHLMAFSGSAVVCPASQLIPGDPGRPVMVAAYTGHDPTSELQEQRIAYSFDEGASWQPLGEGPVIPQRAPHFRDPCLFWHSETSSWIMLVSHALDHEIAFYRSSDLRNWQEQSRFTLDEPSGVECECPELVRLNDPLRAPEHLWLLKVDVSTGAAAGGSGGKYFLGHFDGYQFEARRIVAGPPESEGLWGWVDYGKDFYAAQCFSDERPDAEPVWLGWASNWQYARETPTGDWRGCLSLPRRLSLVASTSGYSLRQTPISLEEARSRPMRSLSIQHVEPARRERFTTAPSFELSCCLTNWTSDEFGIDFAMGPKCRTRLCLRPAEGTVSLDRRASGTVGFNNDFPAIFTAPLDVEDRVEISLIVDRSIAEVFVDGGRIVMTSLIYPHRDACQLSFFARGGTAHLEKADWAPLDGTVFLER